MPGQPTGNSTKVSWKDLHDELVRIEDGQQDRSTKINERIDQLRTETLNRMDRMSAESAERAASERAVLEEIRDSTGALHAVIAMLPCDAHDRRDNQIAADLAQVKGDVTEIKAQLANWKWLWSWVNRRTIAGLIGAALGLLGWENIRATVDKWGK